MLIPKFKWNWANPSEVDELQDLLKNALSNFVQEPNKDIQLGEIINSSSNEDFLAFDDIQDYSGSGTNEITKILQEQTIFPKNKSVHEFPNYVFKQAFIKYNTSMSSSAHVE